MRFNLLKEVPKDLYNCKIEQLHSILKGPSLIELVGESSETLFISTLLHGNETTSFYVLQKLLNDYKETKPKKTILFFIGNTLAASQKMRHLPEQSDFNRIWGQGRSEDELMASEVIEYARQYKLFANIDIHNNTGSNPFYGCINKIESEFLHLASLFSKKIVYFTEPSEVESMAFRDICPSVTIEAGISGEEFSTIEVYNYIKKVLTLDHLNKEYTPSDVSLYHTIARIKVSEDANIDFLNELTDKNSISFLPEIDSHNFNPLIKGFQFGKTLNKSLIRVYADNGDDLTEGFFRFEAGNIIINQIFIPSMLTKDIYVMKKDCLGYVMEKIISL